MSEEGTGAIPVAKLSRHGRKKKRSVVGLVQVLRILRNVGQLRFANAKAADCLKFYEDHPDEITFRKMEHTLEAASYHPIPISLQAEPKSLVAGNSPVELLCNMNQCLLNYAQTYERYKPYRDDMGINSSKYEITLHGLSQFGRYFQGQSYGDPRPPREFWLSPYWPYFDVYPDHEQHLVESGLDNCNQAVDDNDDTTFKAKRRLVLQYLERQYQRIVEVSRDIHRFINIHKRSCGLLDINREMKVIKSSSERMSERMSNDTKMQGYAAKGCVLLEAYADALKHELTLSAKVTIARMRSEFEGYYSSKPREIAIQAVIEAMTNTQDGWNYDVWADNFITAFDDMENQLEEIQEARRELFNCDVLSDWGCDFDVKLGQTNRKRVDWSVNGPGVVFYSRMMRADNDDDDEPL
ncbi:hypothetical protein OCU04_003075 [Sclerotinia nivalis]|uniref:Uncharacterized protein n=1 Tax=Sclerotinia nivalis TaxID=352851 RepID=A0A9X0DMU2_9HELO|nr:hypothetical protein OCU04_003075 [Sclerotinia nivalis]